MWITLEPVAGEEALEFIPGSHLGPLYNGANFDAEEESAPFYERSDMPRLPNIEAEREKWNIVSWPVEPGDVLVLHPSLLHGGAQMHEGGRRRTMSIRFFGDDVRYVERPGQPSPPFFGVSERLKPGDLLRHPHFPLIRGTGSGID
jgi:ectoine hydroxylase-related dioxygenase (phytanoyl-CoA dioxygenase family)